MMGRGSGVGRGEGGGAGFGRAMRAERQPTLPPERRNRTARRIVAFFAPYRTQVVVVLVAILTTSFLGLINPILLKLLIDDVITGRRFDRLNLYVGLMIVIPIISGLIGVGQSYAELEAAAGAAAIHERIGAAGGLRHHGRRARLQALGGREAADRDRAGPAQGSAGPGPRRGDVGPRHGLGAADPGRARAAHGGPDHDRDRAPASRRSSAPTRSWCTSAAGSWSAAPTTSSWRRAASTPVSTSSSSWRPRSRPRSRPDARALGLGAVAGGASERRDRGRRAGTAGVGRRGRRQGAATRCAPRAPSHLPARRTV